MPMPILGLAGTWEHAHEAIKALMTPDLQRHVVEGHPELSFMALNDATPLPHSKHSAAGMLMRWQLLDQAGLVPAVQMAAERAGKDAGMDDVLDAAALAWTAARMAAGTAERIPSPPPVDSQRG